MSYRTIQGIIIVFVIIIWTFFIDKNIENKKLKKYIKILCSLLIFWIMIRTIKYALNKETTTARYLWYLYYFPMLVSSSLFMCICTWNNKNKNYIKILRIVSLIGSVVLFLSVITNDLHQIVFYFYEGIEKFPDIYQYKAGYWLCILWIFLNVILGLVTAIRESRGMYQKQKVIILAVMFILVFTYAIGFVIRVPFIHKYIKDFNIVYSIFFMLGLTVVVYKEKYKETLEETLYDEIENSIKDKTILINKKITNISKSSDKKRDLSYIKMLVSYSKRKSNLIVTSKNITSYTSEELELFLRESIKDASSLGVEGEINIVNKFSISVYNTFIVYAFCYNIFEYCSNYDSSTFLLAVEKSKDKIVVNTMVVPSKSLKEFEFNYEMNKYLGNGKIEYKKTKSDNMLNISLVLPIRNIAINEATLSDKDRHTILSIKSKVHDILGQRLSVVNSILQDENLDENKIEEIKPLLKNILDDLESDSIISPEDMLLQIINTCELAGTKVYVVGNLPKNYIISITIARIMRECATNAIRHAEAKNVYIQILNGKNIELTISNDGKKVKDFNIGDGINGIKNRVDELNGTIEFDTSSDFTVKIKI